VTQEEAIGEVRADFVAEGRRQCSRLLARLGPGFDPAEARSVVHRWSGLGGSVGLPEISRASHALEQLMLAGGFVPRPVLERRLRQLGNMFESAL
jgi:hypothetical protein